MIDPAARARLETHKLHLAESIRALVDLDAASIIPLPEVDAVRLLFAYSIGNTFAVESSVPGTPQPSLDSGRLRSPLPADELARRLAGLKRVAAQARMDRAVHVLYLGLGGLTWRDAQGTTKTAPLWLQRAELERTDSGAIRIVAGKLAPAFNRALGDALRRDHGLVLDPELDLAGLFEAVQGAALTRDGWKVERGSVLAALPVADMAVARDLDALGEAAFAQGGAAALLGVARSETATMPTLVALRAVPDADAAALTKRAAQAAAQATELLAPLDADASQLAAIAAAAAAVPGTGVVIQAPAGSGATQTIANLLVHGAAAGKSMLVVSDRVAGLDAIVRRLASIGLEDVVCPLYARSRDEVVASLARVMDRPFRPASGSTSEDTRIVELRAALDGYAAAMHAVGPFGRSMHDILGRLVELRTAPRAELAEIDSPALDKATFERRVMAVGALAVAALPIEPVSTHPWRTSSLVACDPVGRDRAAKALNEAIDASVELAAAVAAVRALVPHLVALTPPQLVALGALAAAAASSPRPGAELVSQVRGGGSGIDDVGEAIALVRARGGGSIEVPRDPAAFVALAARHRTLQKEVDEVFTDAVANLEAQALWSQLRRWTGRLAPLRYMALRAARAEVEAAAVPGALPTDEAAITALEAVIAERAARAALQSAAEPAKRWFGALSTDPLNVDLEKVESAVAWASELRRAFDKLTFDGGTLKPELAKQAAWRALVAQVAASVGNSGGNADANDLSRFSRIAAAVGRWEPAVVELAAATGIAQAQLGAGGDHLASLREQLDTLGVAVDTLPDWARFNAARTEATRSGVVAAVTAIERGDLGAAELAPAWERATLLAWADAEHQATPALAQFHGVAQHAHVAAFADLDRGALALARARALIKIAERVPRVPRWMAPPKVGAPETPLDPIVVEALALQAEVKSPSGRTLRDVLASLPGLLPKLVPAILATPTGVAEHLDPSLKFDLVIIDEASQLSSGFALGALARGAAAAIVGDGKLLPPVAGQGALADALAAGLPELRLAWHHKARHDELFAPVNARFYDGRLQVLPAPAGSSDLGVSWREADAASVAADVLARLRDPAQRSRSLAVIALDRATAAAIEDRLDAARAADPTLDPLFEPATEDDVVEPVVVRHVDAAHALSRDVIILFASAPVSDRQLALATTRAREQLIVASANEAHPLATELAAVRAAREGEAASPLTDAIARALAERGWIIKHGIGAGPFRVDLAVVDPSDPERYVLAIESDGGSYASATGARDRDRLRAQLLAQLGWKLHRVWTFDWWLEPEREIQRAHGAIVAAIASGRQRRMPMKPKMAPRPVAPIPTRMESKTATTQKTVTIPPAGSGRVMWARTKPETTSPLAVGSGPVTPSAFDAEATPELVDHAPTTPVHLGRGQIAIGPYTAAAIPAGRRQPDDMFAPRHLPELGKVIEQVLAAEAPIHIELLARRVGAYFGIGRVTQRVTDQVRVALAGRGRWGEEQGVVWRLDQDPEAVPPVRVAGSGVEAKRGIEEVPLSELAAAARLVVERATAGERDRTVGTTEIVRDAARLLGFARLTDRVVDRIARGVRLAEMRELIAIDDGRAKLRE